MEGKVNAADFYQLQSDHFHLLEKDTLVPNDLDTGDILLFSRQCSEMSLVGAFLCYAAKQYSPWDHICVIVKDPESKKLYAFEAALSGCQLYELDDRINHSKAPAIAVRYLRFTRTEDQRKEIWKLVNEMNGKPYMSDPNTMVKAGFWSSQKFKRVILHNKESLLKQQIEESKEALRSTAVDPLTYYFLNISKSSLEKELVELQDVIQNERKSRLEGEDVDSEFFCSHSVAHVLKAMNVLPSSVPSTEYLPYSFSSEVELPLLRGASFSKELFLRGNKNSVYGSSSEGDQKQFIVMIQEAILSGKTEKEECKECFACLRGEVEGSIQSPTVSEGSNTIDSQTHSEESETIDWQTRLEGSIQSPTLSEESETINSHNLSEESEAPTNSQPSSKKPTLAVPHENVLSLLSPDDLNYVLTQLRMTRSLGRAPVGALKQLLQDMKISYFLPGDLLQLSDADRVLSLLLRGDVWFNAWSEPTGERPVEHRGRFSLMGSAANPTDPSQLARITADDIAALGCASGEMVDSVKKEAPGIHKVERIQLIKALRSHPAFEHLSFADCYRLSYYFYKVHLDVGDTISREGAYQNFVYYIQKGVIERHQKEHQGWKETTVKMREGCFPGLDAVLNNQPSTSDYVVRQPTTVYVLNPTVLASFLGGRYTQVNSLLSLLRDPDDLSMMRMLEDAVQRISFYNTNESVHGMKNGYSAVKLNHRLYLNDEIESRIHVLTELLELVFCEREKEPHSHKEGMDYVIATGIDSVEESSVVSMINSVYKFFADWLSPPKEGETQELIDEEEFKGKLDRYQKYNKLNDYSDDQIIAIFHSFQFQQVEDIARYLLFLSLTGVSEPCPVTQSMFLHQMTAAGILTDSNKQELLEFFGTNETLSYVEYINKMKAGTLPPAIQNRFNQILDKVEHLLPEHATLSAQQKEIAKSHRVNQRLVLSSNSPFSLLPYPLPVPYTMTFALKQESPSLDYRKYVLGGILGELFGRFMLYPTYLSSYTRLLSEDIRPVNIFKLLMGDKLNFFPQKPSEELVKPPVSNPVKPEIKSVSFQNSSKPEIKSTSFQKPSKPIVISDSHSKEVIRGKVPTEPPMEIKPIQPQVKGVNPIIGGLSRYCVGFLLERMIQFTCFPIILRSVKDAEITADLSLPVQSLIAGAFVGSCVSVLKYPLDRKYMQRVLNLPKPSLSIWKRAYAGFVPSFVHSTLFNAVFFGTFTFFWELNNREYVHDHGFSRDLPHQRDSFFTDVQPVHYDLLGKSVICITCAYMASQLLCYPFSVYKNMKMLQPFHVKSKSPLYSQVNSLKSFFSKANRPVLYGGMWTRLCWSVLSCSMGVAFGSALLTKNYRDNQS